MFGGGAYVSEAETDQEGCAAVGGASTAGGKDREGEKGNVLEMWGGIPQR